MTNVTFAAAKGGGSDLITAWSNYLDTRLNNAELDGAAVQRQLETPDGDVNVAVKSASKAKLMDGVTLQSEAVSVTFPGERMYVPTYVRMYVGTYVCMYIPGKLYQM